MKEKQRLKGKSVLVTGGAKRIGRALVLEFLSLGANVLITYNKSAKEVNSLFKEVKLKENNLYKIKADFKNKLELKKVVKEAYKRFNTLDILVNNASFFPNPDRLKANSINLNSESEFNINLKAPTYLLNNLYPLMSSSLICMVINMLDKNAFNNLASRPNYADSKVALYLLTKALGELNFQNKLKISGFLLNMILPPSNLNKSFKEHRGIKYKGIEPLIREIKYLLTNSIKTPYIKEI